MLGRNALRALAVPMASLCLALARPALPQPAVAPDSGRQVLSHVTSVLRWYRQWDGTDVTLGRTGDELYVETGKDIAEQVVRLEFQSALAQAVLIKQAAHPNQTTAALSTAVDAGSIVRTLQSLGPQIQTLRSQLDAANRSLISAPAKKRAALLNQRDTLQGQLDLALALQDNLQKITSFMSAAEKSEGPASGLTAKIVALQRSVPALEVSPALAAKTKAAAAVPSAAPVAIDNQDVGLIGQIGQLFHLVASLRSLDQLSDETQQLRSSTLQLRAPLLDALQSTLQLGQIVIQAANQTANGNLPAAASAAAALPAPAAPTGNAAPAASGSPAAAPTSVANPPAPPQGRRPMDELLQSFKQVSNATIPLSQELILLDQSEANLSQLQESLKREYIAILRKLLLRVAIILLSLGVIWLFSELWRRATFRYIHDARRRRQFLILRRAITGFCMSLVVILGFVSEFSSLATYAGLITAGIAVALQTVILSVAAYFFLIGRYGVRVGDRITVAYSGAITVSGEVLDIGLVRFYLMELTGSGIDLQPTGRLVVFPNSVLFQTTPLYKQIPGTEYTWRELALPLHPDCGVQQAEQAMLAIVGSFYAEYKPVLERQHVAVEQNLGVQMKTPTPYTRMRFVASGIEILVRYPVPLRKAAELDDRVIAAIAQALQTESSGLKLAPGASPELRSAIKT